MNEVLYSLGVSKLSSNKPSKVFIAKSSFLRSLKMESLGTEWMFQAREDFFWLQRSTRLNRFRVLSGLLFHLLFLFFTASLSSHKTKDKALDCMRA